MKTLIVYAGQTGNTQKLAEAVNDLMGGEKTFCHINEAPEPDGFDLIALGFWLQGGKPDPKSSEYLSKVGGANLFLFATHGACADSAHALNAMEQAKSLAPSARVVGAFNCPGEVNPAFLEKVRNKDPQPPWVKDAPDAVGHPDQSDIVRLTEIVKERLPEFLS
jgi:flavodoxin I